MLLTNYTIDWTLHVVVLCIFISTPHSRKFGQFWGFQLPIRRQRKTPLKRHPFGSFATTQNNRNVLQCAGLW